MTAFRIAGAAPLAVLLGASSALADLSAETVWDELQAFFEQGGLAVTTEAETREGDTLRIEGLVLEASSPDGGVAAELGLVRLREAADGSVAVLLPERYTAIARGATQDEPPEPTRMVLEVAQPGLEIVVSGDDAARDWAVRGPEISVTGSDFTEGGEPVDMSLDFAIRGIDGRYLVGGEDRREITSDFAADAVELAVDAPDDEGGRAAVALAFDDTRSTATATTLPGTPPDDLAAALEAGFRGEGAIDFAASRFTVDGENPDGRFALEGGSGPGALEVALDAGGITYANRTQALRLTISGDQIPVPEIAFSAAESSSRLSLPVLPGQGDGAQGDGAQGDGAMNVAVSLVDLVLPETLWAMFDPSAVLPRDPSTLVIDLGGRLELDRPLFEEPPSGAAAGDAPAPGTVEALTLDEVRFSAAGAEVSGTGELAFDADDTETYGMPKPVGTIELRLVGLQTLLDRLVTIGLVPEDQLFGARLMIGAFARPTEGEDTLTSTIEFTREGQILANGARVR